MTPRKCLLHFDSTCIFGSIHIRLQRAMSRLPYGLRSAAYLSRKSLFFQKRSKLQKIRGLSVINRRLSGRRTWSSSTAPVVTKLKEGSEIRKTQDHKRAVIERTARSPATPNDRCHVSTGVQTEQCSERPTKCCERDAAVQTEGTFERPEKRRHTVAAVGLETSSTDEDGNGAFVHEAALAEDQRERLPLRIEDGNEALVHDAALAEDQRERLQLRIEDSASAEDLRKRLQLRIEDDPYGDCPAPVVGFRELRPSLPEEILGNLEKSGITVPLPIQAQALPLVLAGRDVVGLAQTGSGKTLAFLLPLAARLLATRSDVIASQATRQRGSGSDPAPVALVLAPTRELAVQIANEAEKMFGQSQKRHTSHASVCRAVCVYGGGEKRQQQWELKRGVDVLTATPGRLIDFVETGAVRLDKVTYFVLDEADRMLEYGFNDDVTKIMGKVCPNRQLLFFSATWSAQVQGLAQGLCGKRKPVRISYGQGGVDQTKMQEGSARQAREGITQEVVVVDCDGADRWKRQEEKKEHQLHMHLQSVLEASKDHKVLVFVSQKHLADKVSSKLQKFGFKADSMHGGKSQEYRLWVLEQFRKGALQLLVCTDVLGRGIDIPSVSHVVIHEMGDIEDYIHRIGRTARGQHGSGHALVFFEYWEGFPHLAAELISVLKASKQVVPKELERIAEEVDSGQRKTRLAASLWRKSGA
eukprot:TRINITY_DN32765_c0_g1_i1.p1 TRINITY_DN32765_c0_g1~~TRINITY_DN32765_c0_g1_i1.p1  ORF type:complete len:699 (+),score=96.59 TRINITY_DN32765_c0_g1_i1:2-2098(+)